METDRPGTPPRNAQRAAAVARVAMVLADRLPPNALPAGQLAGAADAATSAVIQTLGLERRYRVTTASHRDGHVTIDLDDARREAAREHAANAQAAGQHVRVYAHYTSRWRRIPVDLDQPQPAEHAAA